MTVIGTDVALAIARERAAHLGWVFLDPVEVKEQSNLFARSVRSYEVRSNAGATGTVARFVIDARSGAVMSESYVPR